MWTKAPSWRPCASIKLAQGSDRPLGGRGRISQRGGIAKAAALHNRYARFRAGSREDQPTKIPRGARIHQAEKLLPLPKRLRKVGLGRAAQVGKTLGQAQRQQGLPLTPYPEGVPTRGGGSMLGGLHADMGR